MMTEVMLLLIATVFVLSILSILMVVLGLSQLLIKGLALTKLAMIFVICVLVVFSFLIISYVAMVMNHLDCYLRQDAR